MATRINVRPSHRFCSAEQAIRELKYKFSNYKTKLCFYIFFMSKQQIADWEAYASTCDLNNPTDNVKLLMHEHTPAIINPMINNRMAKERNCNYFVNMFGSKVQPDGQSFDEINQVYHPSYVPKSFSFLNTVSQVCDPASANACDRHFHDVPSGGKSTLPQGGWMQWGLKTRPYCLQNYRHIKNFLEWLGKEAEDRAKTSVQLMELFYTKVFLMTAGHKIVLEGKKTTGDNYIPYPSANPRNPLGNFKYNWMQQLFPAVDDINNILPLDVNTIQRLSRGWGENVNTAPAAFNGEGNGMYNLWIGDDWRTQEVDRYEDFAKLFMSIPNEKMLEGYRFEEGAKTAFSRFILESRFNLPRFAQDATTGEIVMVQDQIPVSVDVNSEYVRNPQWMDAPLRLAVAPSRDQVDILTRAPLAVHGNGAPIPVIPSAGGWYIKNEYDKECNPNRLLPHWESWNEMGFRPKDPNGSMAVMYRARTYLNAPTNYCDLAPIFTVASPDSYEEAFTNIGCENKRVVQNGITDVKINQLPIRCSAIQIGGTNEYKITVDRLLPLLADSQSITTPVGSNLTVIVKVDNGTDAPTVVELQATMRNNSMGYPYGVYHISFASALTSGSCIKAVRVNDSTPTLGRVLNGVDVATNQVRYILDSPIIGINNDTWLRIRWYNAAGTEIGTRDRLKTVTNQFNNDLFVYTLRHAPTSGSPDSEYSYLTTKSFAASIDHSRTTIETYTP